MMPVLVRANVQVYHFIPLALLALSDECLEHMLNYLTLREQLLLGALNERLQRIIVKILRLQEDIQLLQYQMKLSVTESRFLFRMYGDYIKSATYRVLGDNLDRSFYLALVLVFCRNLEKLTLVDYNFPRHDINSALFTKLKILRYFKTVRAMPDFMCQEISKAKQLEALHIEKCSIDGRYLSALKNLKELSFHDCRGVLSRHLTEILQSNPGITKLNINGCFQLEEINFVCPPQTLRILEYLGVDDETVFSFNFSEMPKLKHFFIYKHMDRISLDDCLADLVQGHSRTLQTLHIYGNYLPSYPALKATLFPNLTSLIIDGRRSFDDNCQKQLAEGCPLLKELRVTNSVLESLLEFIRRAKNLKFLATQHGWNAQTYLELIRIRKNIGSADVRLIVYLYGMRTHGAVKLRQYKRHEHIVTMRFGVEPPPDIFFPFPGH